VLKISKSGPEPAARGARTKRPSPHNAAPAPGQAAATGPADAAREALARAAEGRRKAGTKRPRGLQAQAPPVQAHTPKLAGGFTPDAAQPPRLETASAARENAPARRKNWPETRGKRERGQAAARAGGAAAQALAARKHFDSAQLESVAPLAHELLSLADSLHEVRCELSSEALAMSERVKLRRLETQLSAAFGRTWRLLGLADDVPATMPRGRPPALE
jgi:hypothetical protein